MLSRVLTYLLSASAVLTTVLAAPANLTSVESFAPQAVSSDAAAAGGYKNAAYFVNW
jgi:hypothetical protein